MSLGEQLTVYMRNNVEQICKTFIFEFKSMSQCIWESSWSIVRNWNNKWWRVKLALANRRGFCHLRLIIAALETVRLGTVTNSTKGSFYNSAASYSNRKLFTVLSRSFRQANQVWMRTSSLQSLHAPAGGLGTSDGKQLHQAKRDTSVYKMLRVSHDLPIKSDNLSAPLRQHIWLKNYTTTFWEGYITPPRCKCGHNDYFIIVCCMETPF